MSANTFFMFLSTLFLISAKAAHAGFCDSSKMNDPAARVMNVDSAYLSSRGITKRNVGNLLQKGEVILTFDDGPSAKTTKDVVSILRQNCAHATFFMLGRMIKEHPELARHVAASGHTVGSHGHNHINFSRAGKTNTRQDIELGLDAIGGALGIPKVTLFRFPYLAESKRAKRILASKNIGVVSADVDGRDYLISSPKRLTRRIMQQLKQKGKGIILLHDTKRVTVRALPMILKELAKAGYRIVRMDNVKPGLDPWIGHLQKRQTARALFEPGYQDRIMRISNVTSRPGREILYSQAMADPAGSRIR